MWVYAKRSDGESVDKSRELAIVVWVYVATQARLFGHLPVFGVTGGVERRGCFLTAPYDGHPLDEARTSDHPVDEVGVVPGVAKGHQVKLSPRRERDLVQQPQHRWRQALRMVFSEPQRGRDRDSAVQLEIVGQVARGRWRLELVIHQDIGLGEDAAVAVDPQLVIQSDVKGLVEVEVDDVIDEAMTKEMRSQLVTKLRGLAEHRSATFAIVSMQNF